MAKYIRANAWNSGGTFANKDLYWYAIGVRSMMNRTLDDPASWWFFAAIHGEYVSPDNDPGEFPGWGYIPGFPKVPTTPLPNDGVVDIPILLFPCCVPHWGDERGKDRPKRCRSPGLQSF